MRRTGGNHPLNPRLTGQFQGWKALRYQARLSVALPKVEADSRTAMQAQLNSSGRVKSLWVDRGKWGQRMASTVSSCLKSRHRIRSRDAHRCGYSLYMQSPDNGTGVQHVLSSA